MTEEIIKNRLQSKTYIFGLLITALSFIQSNFPLVAEYLGEYQNGVLMVIGLAICLLREVTKTSLKDKTNARKI